MDLNQLRKDKGLSIRQLSRASGVPLTTVHDLCSGNSDIKKASIETVYRLFSVLGCSIQDIFDDPLWVADINDDASVVIKSNTYYLTAEDTYIPLCAVNPINAEHVRFIAEYRLLELEREREVNKWTQSII